MPCDDSNRYPQVFLARCWVSLFHTDVHWPQTPAFLHVVAQTTKIPIITFEYPGVVNSKLAQTLSFYLQGRDLSFKCLKHCGHEIHDAVFLLLGAPTGGL